MSALEIVDEGDRKILSGLASAVAVTPHTAASNASAPPSRFRFIANPPL
jgi:hypothetical protein